MKAELLFAGTCELGEGARFDPETGRLWWVDILGRRLMRGDPVSGAVETWKFETEIGAAVAMADGRRALLLRDRVEAFDPETGARTLIWHGHDEPKNNRFNDCGVDPAGRLWASSMDFDATAPTGALWRIEPDGTGTRAEHGYPVLNGPVISADGRALYLNDSSGARTLAFDLDLESGRLSNRRVLLEFGRDDGRPDGMTLDAEGNLWIARIGVGRVGCYAPDGRHLRTVALPVPSVTSCAFGGPGLGTLYVTTARILMDEADLAAFPKSGSVFAVETDTEGLPPFAYAGEPG